MNSKTHLPPVILWGIETQIGANIIRELGRRGIPVIGLSADSKAVGFASKYLTRREIAEPKGEALLAQIRRLGEEFGECFLMAISEGNLLFLLRHRDELGKVKPLIPTQSAFDIVLDKKTTLGYAQRHGIDTPRSAQVKAAEDIEAIAGEFPFPAVLKWSDANTAMPVLQNAGLPFLKAEYVYSPEEFRAAMARYSALGFWPMVQEYCTGSGLGLFFFMHRGKPLRCFQHTRVAEWPPEGGTSSVCDAVPLSEHAELREKTVALLRDIQWEGVAMVEYRYDPVRRRAVLMEINGRYWGSYPLAVHCGAGFSLYSYFIQGLGQDFQLPPPRADLRCRAPLTEIKRLIRICLRRGQISDRNFKRRPFHEVARFIADFFSLKSRYFLFSWNDPGPWVRDIRNAADKVFGLVFK
jgi:predicted ATP-grasp superfamily ATP-dependent carboligase